MKKIDQFTNRYELSKTLRFELIPQGKTAENFRANNLIKNDEIRAINYPKVKRILDQYHKEFISRVLSSLHLERLQEYADLYYASNKVPKDFEKIKMDLREQIAKAFADDEKYKGLEKAELIKQNADSYKELSEEKSALESFAQFTTYFRGYNENRKNMYTGLGNSTEVAYRIVDQNLPKFLDNVKVLRHGFERLGEEVKENLNKDFPGLFSDKDICSLDYFNSCLSQEGIDAYNHILSGYVKENGEKVKGINEYINLYNQSHIDKIPQLTKLYKQVLSDRATTSFIPAKFTTAKDVLDSVRKYYESNQILLEESFALLNQIDENIMQGVYVNCKLLSAFSNEFFGDWRALTDAYNHFYDKQHSDADRKKKNYDANREKSFKSRSSFSLKEIADFMEEGLALDERRPFLEILKDKVNDYKNNILLTAEKARTLLNSEYPQDRNLHFDTDNIGIIKSFLDSILGYQRFLCYFAGAGTEADKNLDFHSKYSEEREGINNIVALYNMVRNYISSKPYSIDKIKINFDKPTFLAGWDVNKEEDNRALLFRKGEKYYLGVVVKEVKYSSLEWEKHTDDNSNFQKLVYKQIPSAAKYFSSKQVNPQNPPENIKRYLSKNFDKKMMSPDELEELIRYIAEEFIPHYRSLQDEEGNPYFDFRFRPYNEYASWKEFCDDIDRQSYQITMINISEDYIHSLVNSGKLYLYQIYCKDFSDYSKGKKNLHTLYFEELFSERNAEKKIYKLCGGAEMFYRPASLKYDKPTHPANKAVENKNPHTEKKDSVFEYDLIKDRRYTEDKFFLHIPIEMNFNAEGETRIDFRVREALYKCKENYVIGIDRGERNLIYICVINSAGEIVKQISLNEIQNEYKGIIHKVDYHNLLSKREGERKAARESWQSIKNIKELKEGYLSQVVSVIIGLVEEYDAIVVLEDLNSGFKNSRVKVEKQVYQKFEKMLIDKLAYRVNKNQKPDQPGGILNAYQLVNQPDKKKKDFKVRQNGFLFFIPAWMTSKIDPTTGFVNLLRTRYESVEQVRKFIRSLNSFSYDLERDMFKMMIDYDVFHYNHPSAVSQWELYTNRERIWTHKDVKTGQFISETVDLTKEFKKLFLEYHIDINLDLSQEKLCSPSEKDYYVRFIRLIGLVLQIRNSITGTDVDYLISPVLNSEGRFYNSEDYKDDNAKLPRDADANGAYNIARKGLMLIQQIKNTSEDQLGKLKFNITNAEWLKFAQNQ